MRLSEQQKARLRAIREPARAEGREMTPEEKRAESDILFSCIGEDVTGRVTIRGGDTLLIDGEEVGPVEWAGR